MKFIFRLCVSSELGLPVSLLPQIFWLVVLVSQIFFKGHFNENLFSIDKLQSRKSDENCQSYNFDF